MPVYQTRFQARLQRAQDPEEKFRQDWEKRDIPAKPTRKGVWRLAETGTRWKNISKNAADIPDMVVPVNWRPPSRVPQTHSSVTGAPSTSSTTGVQPTIEAPPSHFLSAIGLQSCSSTVTCHPSESSTVGLHSQSSVAGRPAESCTTIFSSGSEGQRTPRIEQYLHSSSVGRLETGRLEDSSAEGSMMEAPPRHFFSIIGLQSCSSTVTCHSQTTVTGRLAEPSIVGLHSQTTVTGSPAQPVTSSPAQPVTSSPAQPSTVGLHSQTTVTGSPAQSCTVGLHSQTTVTGSPAQPVTSSPAQPVTSSPAQPSIVGLHSRSSITGRPVEPSITDLPEDSWNYTIEGLRIPRIEQFLQVPTAGRHGAGGVEEWDDTQKPVSEVPLAQLQSSIPNLSTEVKALEQCTVMVPSGEIATEVTSADVTKLKESPSTSKPLQKRVREEDDSVLPMPPKKRYLNTHDGTLVKCAQTGIKRKAHHEAPSEELTNVAIRRSSRKIKVPRRMDL